MAQPVADGRTFATSKQNIGLHINNILTDNELLYNSVVKDFFTTASDGKQYSVKFYSLEMILAVGFRIRNPRGVQFRQWANQHLSDYLQKGYVIDKRTTKNPNGRPDHFDELLADIREIRASENGFIRKSKIYSRYQMITTVRTKLLRCSLPKLRINSYMPLRDTQLQKL